VCRPSARLSSNAVPHYREILADPSSLDPRPETLVWSLSAIALIQVGYWIRYRVRPLLPQFANDPLGHILLFLDRMGFVLATSIFGFAFITKNPGFQMPAFRYVVLFVGLFSLFCYTLELERLGRAFMGQEKKPDAPAR
jgi:hypothetical protein